MRIGFAIIKIKTPSQKTYHSHYESEDAIVSGI